MHCDYLIVGGKGFLGSYITASLIEAGIDVFAPTHEEFDLSSTDSINKFLSSNSFDGIIYCAIDNTRNDIIETNIRNLKNILTFKDRFSKWVHISSSAVYAAMSDYQEILPLQIKLLKRPSIYKYAELKYIEEELLNREHVENLYVLRVFEVTVDANYTNICARWKKQIQLKGFCKNEIITPIYIDDLCSRLIRIISFAERGNYNLCGLKKIHSIQVLSKELPHVNVAKQLVEHTGLNIVYDNINREFLEDYYHCYENRSIPLMVCTKECTLKGCITFLDGIQYLESGTLHISDLSNLVLNKHQSDIPTLATALSILPAYSTEVKKELIKLSRGGSIYIDASDEDSIYLKQHICGVHFEYGIHNSLAFKKKEFNLVLSTRLSKRLAPFIFKGVKIVMLEDILQGILLDAFIPYMRMNNITPLFINGPRRQCLPVDYESEPYLFSHSSLEDVLKDKEYIRSFYRFDNEQIKYAYDSKSGLLSGNAITSDGLHLMSAYFKSKYLNVDANGIRRSTPCRSNLIKNHIWIYGSCMAFGLFATDYSTFPSYLQQIINSKNENFQVMNMGVKGRNNILNSLIFAMNTSMNKNDYVIFVEDFNESAKNRTIKNHASVLDFSNYLCAVGIEPNSFLNSTFHANLEILKHLADFAYLNIIDANQNIYPPSVTPLLIESKKNVKIDSFKLLNVAFLNKYLAKIDKLKFNISEDHIVGSIVMAANPFTLGHAGIIDIISNECDFFYVFVIEDDSFDFSFIDRYEMVRRYCLKYNNCRVLPTGQFFGAAFLFPEYHSKYEYKDKLIKPPYLDTLVYAKIISPLLHITRRYVGTEDKDPVTNQFNTYLEKILPTYDIELKVIKRIKSFDDMSISGSSVRQMIKDSHTSESLLKFIPKTTLDVLKERLR